MSGGFNPICAICGAGLCSEDDTYGVATGDVVCGSCYENEAVRCWSCNDHRTIEGFERDFGWEDDEHANPRCAACAEERRAEIAEDAALDAKHLALGEAMDAAAQLQHERDSQMRREWEATP